MDLKIITRHAPSNYGSLLQSIATIKILKGMGHQAQIIDYLRPDERGLQAVLTSLASKRSWNNNLLKKWFYVSVRYPEEKCAEVRFNQMRHRYLMLSHRCSSVSDLQKLDADVFITGSDQVWGPMLNGHYDENYFLSFVVDKPKITYAASFGKTEFTPAIIENYKQMLSRYDAITVREDSAVKMLNDWETDCTGQVLDPTLMLTLDEWNQYTGKEIKKKYVLVYQIHNDRKLGLYAKHFAKSIGLPLIRISPYLHQISREGKLVWLPELGEFLSYIKHCSYFITDSFHGTAFALIFNKQFFEILPNNNTGSRNLSILRLTGLENRIVSNYNDFDIIKKRIDYNKVNAILAEERLKSIKILKDILHIYENSSY